MYKKVLIAIVIVLLGLGNIYLYNQSKKLDYSINIGIPVQGSDSTLRIDFNKPLSDKDEASLLIFSFMSGFSVEKPKICRELPEITVWFNDWKKGITHRQVNMWVDGDVVVIETDVNSEQPNYKTIGGDRASDLKKLIEKYSVAKIN